MIYKVDQENAKCRKVEEKFQNIFSMHDFRIFKQYITNKLSDSLENNIFF